MSEQSVLSILIRAFDYTKAAFQSVASGMKALVVDTRDAGREITSAFSKNMAAIQKLSSRLLSLTHVFMTFWILVDRARDHQISLMRAQADLTEVTWRVEEAQRNLNTAIGEFGPNSEEARKAAEALWLAQEDLRLKQLEIATGQEQFNWTIGVSTVSAIFMGINSIATLSTALAGSGGLTGAISGAGGALLSFCSAHPILLAAAAVAIAAIAAYAANFLGFKDLIDSTVVPGILGAWSWLCTELPRMIVDGWNAIVNGFIAFKDYILGLWDLFTHEGLFAVAQKTVLDIVLAFLGLGESLQGIWTGLIDWLSNGWSGFTEWLGGVWAGFVSWVTGVFDAGIRVLATFLLDLWSGLKATWDDIAEWFGGIWESICNGFNDLVSGAYDWGVGLLNSIRSGLNSAWSNITSFFSDLGTTITTSFSDLIGGAYDWGKNLLAKFVEGLKDAVGSVGDALGDVASTIASFLGFSAPPEKGALSKIKEWGPHLAEAYAVGIESGIPRIIEAASKIGEAAQLSGVGAAANISTRSLTIGSIQVNVTSPGASADEIADEIYRKVLRLL